ncbi:MAG: CsgG/HfaB family protein [Candidatus Zixiibacteriota bacterium]
MKKARWFYSCPVVFLAVCMILVISGQTVKAQEGEKVAEVLSKAFEYYGELEFDKGIAISKELLSSGTISSKDSVAVYAVLSMLTYGKGESYSRQSYDYLEQMASIGPCKLHLPYDFWPQQLRDRWYKIVKEKNALVCPEDTDGKLQTIAIMAFDNFSVGEYQEELGFLTKGIAEFFESDFSKISELKVVERDKIDFLLKELELSKSGAIEAATAAKVGKMLGAQIMVFGSITQLDKNNTKMLVKAVNVETSEIITSVERDGKPEYFKMEKELVKELAEKLNIKLNKETVNLLDQGGTESYDAATLYSKGLYHMDRYEYKEAYDYFKQAYEKDNTFTEAKRKMDIYGPLAA